jgi:hypothetical protein
MDNTKKMTIVVLMFAVCLGTASAEHRTNKKKKMTVTVEENGDCVHGISVSDQSWGDRHLCADYPDAASAVFQKYVGSAVEVEAQWTFEGDPKTDGPVAIAQVLKVGTEKIYDPCAINKLGFIAGLAMAANGADPATAASMAVNPACGSSAGGDQE